MPACVSICLLSLRGMSSVVCCCLHVCLFVYWLISLFAYPDLCVLFHACISTFLLSVLCGDAVGHASYRVCTSGQLQHVDFASLSVCLPLYIIAPSFVYAARVCFLTVK